MYCSVDKMMHVLASVDGFTKLDLALEKAIKGVSLLVSQLSIS